MTAAAAAAAAAIPIAGSVASDRGNTDGQTEADREFYRMFETVLIKDCCLFCYLHTLSLQSTEIVSVKIRAQ